MKIRIIRVYIQGDSRLTQYNDWCYLHPKYTFQLNNGFTTGCSYTMHTTAFPTPPPDNDLETISGTQLNTYYKNSVNSNRAHQTQPLFNA